MIRTASSCRWILGSALMVLLGGLTAGCAGHGSAGAMRVQSLGEHPAVLTGNYVAAFYSVGTNGDPSFMLSDIPVADVVSGHSTHGQILHIELLWVPQPGRTPMDPSATNTTIRLLVISNGEVGMYGGAGFALPEGRMDAKTITLTLRDASMQLLESTAGFIDLLSPAQMTGSFSATRDDQKVREMSNAASQLVTNALGKTRYVLVEADQASQLQRLRDLLRH